MFCLITKEEAAVAYTSGHNMGVDTEALLCHHHQEKLCPERSSQDTRVERASENSMSPPAIGFSPLHKTSAIKNNSAVQEKHIL